MLNSTNFRPHIQTPCQFGMPSKHADQASRLQLPVKPRNDGITTRSMAQSRDLMASHNNSQESLFRTWASRRLPGLKELTFFSKKTRNSTSCTGLCDAEHSQDIEQTTMDTSCMLEIVGTWAQGVCTATPFTTCTLILPQHRLPDHLNISTYYDMATQLPMSTCAAHIL